MFKIADLRCTTLVLSLFLASTSAQALTDPEATTVVNRYMSDPKTFMHIDPTTGEILPMTGDLIPRDLLDAKMEARGELIEAAAGDPFSALEELFPDNSARLAGMKENITRLIATEELHGTGGVILRRPQDMDARGFQSARLQTETWSNPGWSRYRGHTAMRYALKEASRAPSWLDAWSFVARQGNRYSDIAASRSPELIDNLSPAEKYDLLISSARKYPDGLFSNSEWRKGSKQQKESGSVPKWYGYCHGWAPASFMVPRPANAVEVTSFDGQYIIRFYPADIQALASALWANVKPKARLIGTRCNQADPARDENDRVLDEGCFDNNPGVFHMAVVNQLSSAKRNLIMDATYDAQVWNQPIVAYSYKYFNPSTGTIGSLRSSMVPRQQFHNDVFRRYRSRETSTIVGIVMEIEYAVSGTARQEMTDSAASDLRKKAKYVYDLELNANGEIVGGEWHQLRHPDFLWVPGVNTQAITQYDAQAVGQWDGRSQLPPEWAGAAQRAGVKGQPLSKIVDVLVKRARNRR